MPKPIIVIHNVETDEIIEREMNDKEFAQYQADQKKAQDEALKAEELADAKSALLAKLGLTDDEAKLLLS